VLVKSTARCANLCGTCTTMVCFRAICVLMLMQWSRALEEIKVDGVTVIQDSFVGCFWDDGHRDLKRYFGNFHSIEKCRKRAAEERWKYFALQANGQCRVGNTYGHRPRGGVGSAGCDAQCSNNGNWQEWRDKSPERQILHGTGWRNAIYRTEPAIWTIKTSKNMFKNGTYIGCYKDDGNRQYDSYFDGKKTWQRVTSVDECGALAKKWDKPYFAMQVGSECRLGSKLFPEKGKYPPRYATTQFFSGATYHYACQKGSMLSKTSKQYPNYGGRHWTNSVYHTNPSPYYPAAYWDSPAGDSTIRFAFARAFCLNIAGGKPKDGKWKANAKIVLWPCVNKKDKVDNNMQFEVEDGYIKLKDDTRWCVTKQTPRDTNEQLTLQKCGTKGMWQKISTNDDMTITWVASPKSGFNVWNIPGRNKGFNGWQIRSKPVYSYVNVDGYWNELFAIQSAGPPTPKPTPAPTPPPGHKGLKAALGWKVEKGWKRGKGCTIQVWGGAPCAVSPNYPKGYGNGEKCVVSMGRTKAVTVVDFSTEKYFDRLKIAGKKLSGAPVNLKSLELGKDGHKMVWSSDFYLGSTGWKVCRTKAGVPKPPPKPKCDETLKGHKDRDYRGCQTRTKTGRKCQKWADQKPHKHGHMSGWKVKHYGLHGAACRNPDNLLRTIWCYTTDPKMKKEECYSGDYA
jgi:hypothetical protein